MMKGGVWVRLILRTRFYDRSTSTCLWASC